MKFEADALFDKCSLFCRELDEGFQVFNSWAEFIELYIEHMHCNTKPLYVMKCHVNGNNVFVDASQFVVIPWDDIENYM